MDIVTVLRYVHDHNVMVSGTLVALFLATCILLLIRMIGEKTEGDSPSRADAVDLKALENTMKKVLATQTVSVAAAPVAATRHAASTEAESSAEATVDAAELERMQSEIATRNELISNLEAELAVAKNAAARAQKAAENAGENGGGGDDSELKAKLADLEARLAEYSIIEDDIADLSLFKEENSKLKGEIAALREQLETAAKAPAPAVASKVKVENEASLKFEKAEKFELDPNDDIMKEFALAVEDKRAPMPDSAFSVPAEEINKLLEEDNVPRIDLKPLAEEVAGVPSSPPATAASTASTAKTLSPEEEAQAKIDAMFATATGGAAEPEPAPAPKALSPEEEAQAKIDAMFASSFGDEPQVSTPEPELEPELVAVATPPPARVLTPEEEAQASIDAMLANAEAELSSAVEESSTFAEPPAAEPAAQDDAFKLDEDLLGSLDTDKMLSEVEILGDAPVQDDGDALTESLDTDKLLAEVDTLEPSQEAESAAAPIVHEKPPVVPEPLAAKSEPPPAKPEPVKAPPKAAAPVKEAVPVDDLLAEFEDESKLGS